MYASMAHLMVRISEMQERRSPGRRPVDEWVRNSAARTGQRRTSAPVAGNRRGSHLPE